MSPDLRQRISDALLKASFSDWDAGDGHYIELPLSVAADAVMKVLTTSEDVQRLQEGFVEAWLYLRREYGSRRQVCRPDYLWIARMEREVWGETFEHAGAPQTRTGQCPAVKPDGLCCVRDRHEDGPHRDGRGDEWLVPAHAGAPEDYGKTLRHVMRTMCMRCGCVRTDGRCGNCERQRTMRTVRAEKIAELRGAGYPPAEIAAQLGLAPQTVLRYMKEHTG